MSTTDIKQKDRKRSLKILRSQALKGFMGKIQFLEMYLKKNGKTEKMF